MSLSWTPADIKFLTTMYSALFQTAFEGTTPDWPKIATKVTSSGRTNMYGWLGEHPQFREFVDERKIQEVSGSTYELTNKKWESTIALQKDDVEDNQLDSYEARTRAMGEAAAQHPDELVFAALTAGASKLCYDGQYFFDTDHSVNGQSVSNRQSGASAPWFLLDTRRFLKPLLYQVRQDYEFKVLDDTERAFTRDEVLMGAKGRSIVGYGMWRQAYMSEAALDDTAFKAARAVMESYKTDIGRPARVVPNIIVVGPSNRSIAEELFLSSQKAGGATNPLKGAVEILVTPYLP